MNKQKTEKLISMICGPIVCILLLVECFMLITASTDSDLMALKTPLLIMLVVQAIMTAGLVMIAINSAVSGENRAAMLEDSLKLLSTQIKKKSEKEDFYESLVDAINEVSNELTESKRMEKMLLDRAIDVIFVIDITGNIVSINKACEKSWGYPRNDVIGKPLQMFLEGDDANRPMDSILGAAKSIDKLVFESKLRKKDGYLLDIVVTGHWSARESGLFCIAHDITQQKLVERMVRLSEQRLRLTLEALPAGVLVARENGKIEFANRCAAQWLDYSAEQLSEMNVSQVFKDKVLDQGYGMPSNESVESTTLGQNNINMPVEIWRSNIEMAEGEKILLVFLDKTAHYELERMKAEFIAMVTHDLRAPLTSVTGILTFLEQGALGQMNEKGKEMAARTRRDCNNMLRLLNDMLQLEKIEVGSFELTCSNVTLNAMAKDAIESVRPVAEAKRVSISDQLLNTTCWGDEQRLNQVLTNLLTNAIKYAPEGSKIEVRMRDNKNFVIVEVADQGRGIPQNKIKRIFEKFEQVDASDAREKGGTGLGLAICKAIVAQHGGEIGVESMEGQGSTFWFSVPKAPVTVPAPN